jgi:uncharacterized secreted protein with C-terminal beta-propeller domain
MFHPSCRIVISIALAFLLANRLTRDAGTPGELEMPGVAGYPHPVTQNLLLAVRTTEWQTVETGLLEVSALAPPRSPDSLIIDGASLADAMTDPQTFAYLPADTAAYHQIPTGGAISASPSSR